MNENNLQRAFFVALVLAVTATFFWLIRGFMQPIFWAVALGIVVYPLHARITTKLHDRKSLAAIVSLIIVIVLVILPLIGVGTAVAREGAALYNRLNEGDTGIDSLYSRIEETMPQIASAIERVGLDPARLEEQIQSFGIAASRAIASRALSIGQETLQGAIFFFLTLYLLFFFLRDGSRMLDGLVRALPLGDHRERHLLERFAEVSRATIKGTLVVGIVQGTIGGIAFAVLGIAAPVLWGVVMALLSILPAVGSALVWVPAAVYLIFNDQLLGGIGLIVVGVLVIGSVDNVLRPILVGRDTRMPDYLILLATLGGLAGFGLAGIIIGPIIAAFFLSVWHMMEQEFAYADAQTGAAGDPPQAPPGNVSEASRPDT